MPTLEPGAALLRVDMVGICGGDVLEWAGLNPKVRFPMILGHEVVGTLVDATIEAQSAHGVSIGSRVAVEPYILCRRCRYCLTGQYQFCQEGRVYGVSIGCSEPPHFWGAYGEYLYMAPGSKVHVLPPDLDVRAGCLTSVIGNAVRWVRTLGQAQVGDRVLVLGSGAQALASVIVAREAGAAHVHCVASSRRPASAQLAERLGARILSREEFEHALPDAYDLMVECQGDEADRDTGMRLLRPQGRLVQVATSGRPSRLDFNYVVFKELTIRGGLGQSWDTEAAVNILTRQRYPVQDVISDVFRLDEAANALERLASPDNAIIHAAIVPSSISQGRSDL